MKDLPLDLATYNQIALELAKRGVPFVLIANPMAMTETDFSGLETNLSKEQTVSFLEYAIDYLGQS